MGLVASDMGLTARDVIKQLKRMAIKKQITLQVIEESMGLEVKDTASSLRYSITQRKKSSRNE